MDIRGKKYWQVFIFVAHKEQVEAPTEGASPESGSPPPLTRSEIVVYALIPRLSLLADLFEQNGVIVLRTDELPPFLLEAARSGRVEFLDILVRVGHRILDSSGQLIVTVDPFNSDILPLLLNRCVVDESTRHLSLDDITSSRTFRQVWKREHLAIFARLATAGPDLKYRHDEGGTLLHFAVKRKQLRLVEMLLEDGANLESKNKRGETPLLLAVKTLSGNVSPLILTRLLESGANVNAEDAKGATPFLVALKRQKSTDLIRILIDNGADVNANTQFGSALEFAAEAGFYHVSLLLDHGGLDIDKHRDSFKEILRHSTADWSTVRKLFDYGFKLLPEDAKSIQILDAVLEVGDRQIFEDLLRWGAVVHLKPRPKRTVPDAAPKDVMKELLILALNRDDNDDVKYLFEIDDVREAEFFNDILREAITTFNAECFQTILKVGNPGLSCLLVENVLDELEPVYFHSDIDDAIDYLISVIKNEYQNDVRHEMKEALSRHIVMLASADLVVNEDITVRGVPLRKDQLPEWVPESVPSTFLEECINEVALLKTETVGDSSITYYDILNATIPQIIRFLRSNSIRCTLRSRSYFARFPLFSPIIYHRFRKCDYKVALIEKASQVFGHLSEFSKNIPFEIREKILQLLCNHELLMTIDVCTIAAGETASVSTAQ
nr:PREDICTED: uncharacterized protein LOC109035712 isoform X2 [Bemisia tabaci]